MAIGAQFGCAGTRALSANAHARPGSQTVAGRVALFFGIVWSIAGAFLLLLQGIPALLVAAVAAGLIPSEIAMRQDHVTPTERCGVVTVALSTKPAAADAASLQRTRYAAFLLGRTFGLASGVAFAGLGGKREQYAPLLQEARDQATALGVLPPELPAIQHMSTALGEFADKLGTDPQCTAASLASRYSPSHGNIYRFGVVVGYSALYCAKGVCGAHGVQIRGYGTAAGVPEQLWQPMADGSLDGVPGANDRDKTMRLLRILDEYMRSGG